MACYLSGMHRRVALLLAVVAFGWGGNAEAALRAYEKLSVGEQVALQESERRVCVYDRQLQTLDHERARHKISSDE